MRVHFTDLIKHLVKKKCLIDITHLAENHKINLIFDYENSMELFTIVIILEYVIGDTRDNSSLLLRLIDAHI